MPSTGKRGFDLNAGQTELTIKFNGSERVAFDATGLSFNGATPVAQQGNIAPVSVTGTYTDDDEALETAINSIINVLVAYGLIAPAP